jgi:hypothetical protein
MTMKDERGAEEQALRELIGVRVGETDGWREDEGSVNYHYHCCIEHQDILHD